MKPAQVRFTFAQAAAIAGIKLVTLNSMFFRKQMFFGRHEITPAARRGAPKQLTFAGLFKVAILAHLLKLGMPPTRAWAVTMAFTETGSQPLRDRKPRPPGHLFEQGDTFLSQPVMTA